MARSQFWPSHLHKFLRTVPVMTENLASSEKTPLRRLLLGNYSTGSTSGGSEFAAQASSGLEDGIEAERSTEGWTVLNALRKLRAARKLQQQKKQTLAIDSDAVRSEADIASVVEQRVQQSFREGDFGKLHGIGKPLPEQTHPHNDPADEMAYRLLKRSGFAPDWVELNKDIRFQIRRWRRGLEVAYDRENNNDPRRESWQRMETRLEEELMEVNKKVAHYNLIVPFGRQVLLFKMERELKALLTKVGR